MLRTARRRRRTGVTIEGSGRRCCVVDVVPPALRQTLLSRTSRDRAPACRHLPAGGTPEKTRHLPSPVGTFARQERCMTMTKTEPFHAETGPSPSAVAWSVLASMRLNLVTKASTSQQRLGVAHLPRGEGGRSGIPASPHHGFPALPVSVSTGWSGGRADRGRDPVVVIAPLSESDSVVTATSEKVRHDQANDHQRERARRDPRRNS